MALIPTMDPFTASVVASGGMFAAPPPYLPMAACAATPLEPVVVPPPLYQPMVVPATTVLTNAPYAAASLGMMAPAVALPPPALPLPIQYPYDGFTAPLLPYY